jgi:hypothetical protein
MKRVLGIIICFMFLFSFVFVLAESNEGKTGALLNANLAGQEEDSVMVRERIQTRVNVGERLDIRRVNGSRIAVELRTGERLRIHANNFSADTRLNLSQNGTMLRTRLSNGRNAEIKVMPDVVAEMALKRLRLKNCNETSNNCTIELKEVGNNRNNETNLRYELQVERHYKILGLFKAKAKERVEIDAETGEVENQNRVWWRFMAMSVD